jgi:hypothetical protein
MSDARFKVLLSHGRKQVEVMLAIGCPRDVPWSLMAPHERQANRNHDQTLERLNERGGLAPCEMVAVIEDRPWRKMDDIAAVETLLRHLRNHAVRDLWEVKP